MNKGLYKNSLHKFIDTVEVNRKSFLITGASGLIGSCLTDLLMEANLSGRENHVYALGRSKSKLKKRFSDYYESGYFHIIEQDVCQPLDDSLEFDYIIHGASNADPVSYAKYPVETMTINLLGGINVLEYGKKHPNCQIVILSTFEVYGNAGKDEYSEEDAGLLNFNQLRSCYPESKRTIETLSKCYYDEYGVSVIIGRLASIYGPTMAENDSKAHAQFLRNALEGKDIVLKSKGEQLRTYCYVIDAVTGILCVLFHGCSNMAYNISNENSVVSIAEVAQTVADIAGTKVILDLPNELEAKGFSKPQNCILNNDRLRDLGWQGRYNLQAGIEETYNVLK